MRTDEQASAQLSTADEHDISLVLLDCTAIAVCEDAAPSWDGATTARSKRGPDGWEGTMTYLPGKGKSP